MPRASSYEHRSVLSATGKRLGTIGAVLYDASRPRVVGFQVDRPGMLGLVERQPGFVLLADASPEGSDVVRVSSGRLPKDSAGEQALGYSWDLSVIWRSMPVRSESGERVGVVQDVVFEAESGDVKTLIISTGIVGDVALGRLEVPGELVRGFDKDAVIVLPGYNEIRAGGGAAKAIAAGTTAVKTRTGQVADGALQVGVAGARALGKSLKSGTGRKAIDKLKSLMRDDE